MLAGQDTMFPTPAALLPLAGRVRGQQQGLRGLERSGQLIAAGASFQGALLLTLPTCDFLSRKIHPCRTPPES